MASEIEIDLTEGATQNAEWAGIDPADDVRRVRAGLTEEALLDECLRGVEDEAVAADWHEYVDAIMVAASKPMRREKGE